MLRIKPIKNFKEYEDTLNELEKLEMEQKEDSVTFRAKRNLIRKFEKPYIEQNEKPD